MALRAPVARTAYTGLRQIVGPTSEPVSLAELKAQLGLDESSSADDPRLFLLASAAREMIEQYTGLALVSQQWRMTLDRWPGARAPWWDGVREGAITDLHSYGAASWVILPRYPLISVDAVRVFDDADTPATVSVAQTFVIDAQQEPGRMVLRGGATWPVALRSANAIEIDFSAGYAQVPASLKLAVLQVASYLYGHPGDCTAQHAILHSGAQALLGAHQAARL